MNNAYNIDKRFDIVSYLYVSCSGSITSVGGERELIISCLLAFTCNNVVSVPRGFLFLLLPGIGCLILFWHSLGLPYNDFEIFIL